jgi:hypothetical protein
MRKFTATILAICFGILLPAAAMPMRVCLLDQAEQSEDCCGTCSTNNVDCCVDSEGLPDSQLPSGSFETPPFVGNALPPTMAELPRIPESIVLPPCLARPPNGIGSTTARLAVLSVWRL